MANLDIFDIPLDHLIIIVKIHSPAEESDKTVGIIPPRRPDSLFSKLKCTLISNAITSLEFDTSLKGYLINLRKMFDSLCENLVKDLPKRLTP